jgi:hypothetical protein
MKLTELCKKTILTLFVITPFLMFSQNNITITDEDSHNADPSSVLDVYSTTKGMLVPRMTTDQRNAILNPAEGLLVFDVEYSSFFFHNGTGWVDLSGSGSSYWSENSTSGNIYLSNSEKNLGIGTDDPVSKLEVMANSGADPTATLFEIKDEFGKPIFSVTSEGIRMYVKDLNSKGVSGGFAIGRYSAAKEIPDTTLLLVTSDSTRIYIDEDEKGVAGGFAIGRYASAKSSGEYFKINGANNTDIITDQAGMFWYPLKEAFLVGRVNIEDPNDVGFNSFSTGYHSNAGGNYSQAMGFQTQSYGDYSTAIGKNAISSGINSFALGDSAQAMGDYSYCFGNTAQAIGRGSFAFGVLERFEGQPPGDTTKAIGDYSVAIGVGAIAEDRTSISMGVNTVSSGQGSIALGYVTTAGLSGAAAIGLYCNATGSSSVAMGNSCTSTDNSSFAAGTYCDATAPYASAIGCINEASGSFSTAIGYNASTNGFSGSFVIGASDATTWGTPVIASAPNQFTVRAVGGHQFFTDTEMNTENGMFISPVSGNVGIGTNLPTTKLHVNDVMRLEPRITEPDNPSIGDIYYHAGTKNTLRIYTGPIGGWKDVQLN